MWRRRRTITDKARQAAWGRGKQRPYVIVAIAVRIGTPRPGELVAISKLVTQESKVLAPAATRITITVSRGKRLYVPPAPSVLPRGQSPLGQPIYERIGFREVSYYRTYVPADNSA